MKKTRKKTVTTIVLLCCLGLLIAGYFFLVQYNKNKEKRKSEEAAKKSDEISLLTNSTDEVSSLSITSNQLSIVFVKDKTCWTVEGKPEFPLDQDQAETMVKNIAELSVMRIVTKKAESLSDFGLTHPLITIGAKFTDGSEKTLLIGERSSVAPGYYAKLSDEDTIYLFAATKENIYNKTETALFKKPDLYPTDASKYLEIEARSPKGKGVHLTYLMDDSQDLSKGCYPWRLVLDTGERINADPDKISSYLSKVAAVTGYTGVAYGREVLDQYGLLDAKGLLYLKYKDDDVEHEFTLHIGNQDENGDYYVCLDGSDIVYLVRASLLDCLFNEEEAELESKLIHLINIELVSSIDTKIGKSEHEFTIKAGSKKDSSEYFMDDSKFEKESTFKSLYQSMIGIDFVKHLPKDTKINKESVFKLTFHLTDDRTISSEYFPLNENEYAVAVDGKVKFSCKKSTVDQVIEAINTVNTSE